MTLHDAIEKLLIQTGRPMTTSEIANGLNKNKWYQKKDGSTIDPFQIHGRTKNYPQLFNRNGSTVSLAGQTIIKPIIPKLQNTNIKKEIIVSGDISNLEKELMNENNFKNVLTTGHLVPDKPGLYCIRINNIDALPKPFDNLIRERNHNIIYFGIATTSLRKRFYNQELSAKGHGTFFRSIGAVLSFRPPKGSLLNMANKRNYKFHHSDQSKIIEWINKNLKINWIEINDNLENIETGLIIRHKPLFNLAKNPAALRQLSDLRAECVRIANT